MAEVELCHCHKSIHEKDVCCPHPAKSGSKFCGVHKSCGKNKIACARVTTPKKKAPVAKKPVARKSAVEKRPPTEYITFFSKRNKELKKAGVEPYAARQKQIGRQWMEKKALRTPLPDVTEEQLAEFSDTGAWDWPEEDPMVRKLKF